MSINFYAYTYPAHVDRVEKLGGLYVKFGDTHRAPQTRMNEQGGASEAESKITIGTWLNVTTVARDYEVHEVLKKQGCTSRNLDGKGTEWFRLPVGTIEEAKTFLDDLLESFGKGTSKMDIKLRPMQDESMKRALKAIAKARKTSDRVNLVAHQCPRFGKTIWALSLFGKLNKKYGTQVMLLPSYWLSVHSSFADTIPKFRDYQNMTVIDTQDDEAEKEFKAAIKAGKQVVITMSLHGDLPDWKARNAWLSKINKEVFVFSDEADYGSHTERQVDKLRFILEEGRIRKSVNVFASGTNIQRIAKNANGRKIDDVIDVAYSQLERTQTAKEIVRRNYFGLHYEGLHTLLEAEFTEDQRPSWTKIWKKPHKCQAFLSTLIRGVLGYEDDLCGLNLSNLVQHEILEPEEVNGVMVFTAGTKASMAAAKSIFEKAVPDYAFIVLNGDETTNKKAEDEVNKQIRYAKEDGKAGFVIIANQMGSRSFSIPEIQASLVMYDNGSIDATMQKVSRCLTPGKKWNGERKERGHICSFSFDPNRNENIENMVLYEAIQVSRSEDISFADAVKLINKTLNIFRVGSTGDAALVSAEDLFEVYGENENLLKVADVSVDLPQLFDPKIVEILGSIEAGAAGKAKEKFAKLAPKAKTFAEKMPTLKNQRTKKPQEQKDFEKLVNQAIRSINRSAATVYNMSMAGTSYRDCLVRISKNRVAAEQFADVYGITAEQAIVLVDENVLNTPLLDVVVENTRNVFDTDVFEIV